MDYTALEHDLLVKEEEYLLLSQAQAGDGEAANRLIAMNQRLVYKFARRYYSTGACGDQELEDIMQWGNMGLYEAIKRWDASRGVRFSTYAVWWVICYIRRFGILRGISFGVSHRFAILTQDIRRARSQLTNQAEGDPTTAEIAATAGVSEDDVLFALKTIPNILRLDAPRSAWVDNDERDWHESLGVHDEYEVDAQLLINAVGRLPSRQRFVLASRFGLTGINPQTHAQLALRLGVSSARVQQIEKAALGKLRDALNPSCA